MPSTNYYQIKPLVQNDYSQNGASLISPPLPHHG
jgi:hypothetical protein